MEDVLKSKEHPSSELQVQQIFKSKSKDYFIGVDFAKQESQLVYSWSNGEGGMVSHTECKSELCEICNPGRDGFDLYAYVAKKHGVERSDVKKVCLRLFYFDRFNPGTKTEMVEGIEKELRSMGLIKMEPNNGH